MLTAARVLLFHAKVGGYGIGAFNVYNLEQVHGVIAAAEALGSPVILQMLPKALELGGPGLIKLCLAAAEEASVPVAVHLDHCSSQTVITRALAAGVSSVMADGSHLPYEDNVAFTRDVVLRANKIGALVEAELGRLSGTEDDWTVDAADSRLTDPQQARDFVRQTRVGALAVCIGNVHGAYRREPDFDFERLEAIASRLTIPIVLHGTSGLPDAMIWRSIESGVCKFNVNTELREAYLGANRQYMDQKETPDLVELMRTTIEAVSRPVKDKMFLFGSAGKAG